MVICSRVWFELVTHIKKGVQVIRNILSPIRECVIMTMEVKDHGNGYSDESRIWLFFSVAMMCNLIGDILLSNVVCDDYHGGDVRS